MAQFRLLPSGKVQVVVRRRGHEPIYGTFPNKTIAKAWAQDVERKIWEKSYLPTAQLDRVLFSAIVDDFAQRIVSRMRGQKSARSRLKTLCTSFGPTLIGQITSEHVIEYVDRRLQSITGETMRKELTLFSRVFRYAMNIKKLPLRENPVVTAREEFALTKRLNPDERAIGGSATRKLTGLKQPLSRLSCPRSCDSSCKGSRPCGEGRSAKCVVSTSKERR